MGTAIRAAFDKAVALFIQETWKLRGNEWDPDPHYPGALSVFIETNIDGQSKVFRVHIREFDPPSSLPSSEKLTPEEENRIQQYLIERSEKAALYRQERFDQLAHQWSHDTRHLSSVTKMIIHPAYLQIIGMGTHALPLILRALQQHSGHWFPALFAISGEDPATEGCTFEEARKAWIDWGMRKGYLPKEQ